MRIQTCLCTVLFKNSATSATWPVPVSPTRLHRSSRGRWAVCLVPVRRSHCSHGKKKMMNVSAEVFKNRIISKGRGAARSPDLTSPDFLLWMYLKHNVYRNRPSSVDKLKMEIEVQIRAIDENTSKRIFENMIRC